MTYTDVFLTGAYAFIVLLWFRCGVLEYRLKKVFEITEIQRQTITSMSIHLGAVSDFTLRLHLRIESLAQSQYPKSETTST